MFDLVSLIQNSLKKSRGSFESSYVLVDNDETANPVCAFCGKEGSLSFSENQSLWLFNCPENCEDSKAEKKEIKKIEDLQEKLEKNVNLYNDRVFNASLNIRQTVVKQLLEKQLLNVNEQAKNIKIQLEEL